MGDQLSKDKLWTLLKEQSHLLTVALPIFSLIMSGTYFFGFFSIVGFKYGGTIGLSDFSKSALSWSPSGLLLLFGFLAGGAIPAPKSLRETEALLDKIKDGSLDIGERKDALSKAGSILDGYRRRRLRLKENVIFGSKIFVISIIVISNSLLLYFFLTAKPTISNLYIQLFPIFIFGPVAYYNSVHDNFRNFNFSILILMISLILVVILVSGRSTATALLNPSNHSSGKLKTDGTIIDADSFLIFDYSVYVYNRGTGLSVYNRDQISVVISDICTDDFMSCVIRK